LFTALDGSDARLIYQGVFYMFAATALASGLACGNLYIDYEIEFNVPQLSIVTVDEGVQGYCVQNVGDAATNCTLIAPLGTSGNPPIPDTAFLPSNTFVPLITYGASDMTFTFSTVPQGQYLLLWGSAATAITYPSTGVSFGNGASNSFISTDTAVSGSATYFSLTLAQSGVSGVSSSTIFNGLSTGVIISTGPNFSITIFLNNLNGTSPSLTGTNTMKFYFFSLGSLPMPKKGVKPSTRVKPVYMDHGRMLKDQSEADLHVSDMELIIKKVRDSLERQHLFDAQTDPYSSYTPYPGPLSHEDVNLSEISFKIGEVDALKELHHKFFKWDEQRMQKSHNLCSCGKAPLPRAPKGVRRVINAIDMKLQRADIMGILDIHLANITPATELVNIARRVYGKNSRPLEMAKALRSHERKLGLSHPKLIPIPDGVDLTPVIEDDLLTQFVSMQDTKSVKPFEGSCCLMQCMPHPDQKRDDFIRACDMTDLTPEAAADCRLRRGKLWDKMHNYGF